MPRRLFLWLKKRADSRYQVSKMINGKRKYFYGSIKKAATEAMEKYVNANQSCANFDGTITSDHWINIWLQLKEKTYNTGYTAKLYGHH